MRVISGIYMIECVMTGERYVGSSEDIDRRWSTHRSQLKRRIHHSSILQARWNEYGPGSLRFEIIEIVDPKHLISKEREYIKSGDFFCNAKFPMLNPMKGRRHSPASIALMSANRRGKVGPIKKGDKLSKEFGLAVSKAKKGRTHRGAPLSPEAAARATARLRAAGNGHRLGMKHTAETRAKMKAAAEKRAPAHYRRGSDHGSFGRPSWNRGIPAAKRGEASAAKKVEINGSIFPSLIDAADALGVCVSTLHKRRQRGAIAINEVHP